MKHSQAILAQNCSPVPRTRGRGWVRGYWSAALEAPHPASPPSTGERESFCCSIRVLVLLVLFATTLHAQSLDRSKIPSAGKTPELHVPKWTTSTLSNGAMLIISERHELPLISFSITFLGGSSQVDTPQKRGLSSLTSSMMSEGTTSRTGDQLADALQLLGTNVSVGIGSEEGAISFVSTKAKFEPVLAIAADMLLHPAFPNDSLERLRAQTLVSLTLAKNRPESIGARVFPKVIYGNAHPYGIQVTEESLKAITRDDIVALHKSYYQPARAIITVVGDVDASIKNTIEKALEAWGKGGEKPTFDYAKLPEPKSTTIYLVDKPGAAQSIVAIGLPGPARNTPDYFPLLLMNRILGGQFQSRLNHNIREVHGYSYGVNSAFSYGHGPGAFRAGGAIVSDKTDAAMIEFMREIKGVMGEKPITAEELQSSKEGLIQELPRRFASVTGIGNAITDLYTQGLPEDYFQAFAKNVSAVTLDDVARVAKKYIDIDHLAIVIVGDRASIEAPLKGTNIAPIVHLDVEANSLPN